MADTLLDRAEQSYLEAMQAFGVPAHLCEGLVRYLVHFVKPGSFLTAVLENDLIRAFRAADQKSLDRFDRLVSFLCSNAPANAWGSRELVQRWLDQRKAG